ncbi:MAG: S8 family serine peptidase [Chloroflexi bacterium]|nr:S8 family serine peptidase [Chloroflexota bacterium]
MKRSPAGEVLRAGGALAVIALLLASGGRARRAEGQARAGDAEATAVAAAAPAQMDYGLAARVARAAAMARVPERRAMTEGGEAAPAAGTPGRAVVRFTGGVPPRGALAALLAGIGARERGRIEPLGTVLVSFDPGVPWESMRGVLISLPGVVEVSPDGDDGSSGIPNDPRYPDQAWYMDAIGAAGGWDLETGSGDVIVAVIDSGADLGHAGLAANTWTNPGEVAADGVDNDGNGCIDDVHGCLFLHDEATAESCNNPAYALSEPTGDIRDDYGHGTSVASLIGTRGNDGQEITGVAWRVSLMHLKSLDCTGKGSRFDSSAAIVYAVENGARIINLSLGGGSARIPVQDAAIAFAQARGVLVVAAVGNAGGARVDFPAAIPGVLAVGATDASGTARAEFSNYGPEVGVAAPGEGMLALASFATNGSGYRLVSGTSFSTPLVSGVAALLLAADPLLDGAALHALIEAGAVDKADGPAANWDGAGVVNAQRSLQRLPASFAGLAGDGYGPLPPNTAIEALVAGKVCGRGATFEFDGGTWYTLNVDAAVATAACGSDGAAVTLRLPAQPGLTFATTWLPGANRADAFLAPAPPPRPAVPLPFRLRLPLAAKDPGPRP